MSKENKIFFKPVRIQLAEKGIAPSEIQVIRTGNFTHPFYGHFSITSDFLLGLVKNFEADVRGCDLSVDYDHEVREAAGWIKSLSIRNNELWAEIDWTPAGKKSVEEKEFRYTSADFGDYIDPESQHNFGPTLFGVALTNRPFVKRMAPTTELNELKGDEMKTELETLKEENKTLNEKLSALTAENKKLAEDGEGKDEMEKEIEQLKAKNAQLEKENKDLKADKELSEKKAAFGKLLSEGKVVKAQEEAYLAGDMAKFAELAGEINTEAQGTGADNNETTEASAEDEVIKLAEKLVADGKAKDLGAAQSIVLNENPELRAKLYN